MKFAKDFYICRHDEDVPMKVIFMNCGSPDVDKCSNYDKGKCNFDNKKCKVVKYERVDNFSTKSK